MKVVGTREGAGGIIEEIFDFDEVWEDDPPGVGNLFFDAGVGGGGGVRKPPTRQEQTKKQVDGTVIVEGPFRLDGNWGSSIILFSGRELGTTITEDLTSAGQAKYNSKADGSPVNLSINIDNAAAAGMSVADYIKSQLGDRTFDNIIFSFHGGETGSANANVLATFGPNSNINSVLKSAVTGNGAIVYNNCYGIAASGAADQMANIYGMDVLTSSLGQVYQSAVDLKPSIPINPNDPNSRTTTTWGFWVVTSPKPPG